MFTMMTVLRKRPEVSTEQFRHFMQHEYGPTYVALPETVSYTQHYLSDVGNDGTEHPIDAIVTITFESPEIMQKALDRPGVAAAARRRDSMVRATTVGIHPTVVEATIKLV